MREVLFGVSIALSACGGSVDPTGTEECAIAGSEVCPAPCTALRSARLDSTQRCRTQSVAICSRAEFGRLALDRCCVRTADDAVFSLPSGTQCPVAPAHPGWRDCTSSENDALQTAASCE